MSSSRPKTFWRGIGRTVRGVMFVLPALVCSACFAPDGPKVVTSPDPALKIPAIKTSVENKDFSAVKQLVKDLDSDDPAVRFYSISALEKLTGQTFGYHYFVEDEKRAAAVEKWKAWYEGWEAGQREAVAAGSANNAGKK